MKTIQIGRAKVRISTFNKSFLELSFTSLWNQYQKETGAVKSAQQAFMYGLFQGVKEQLRESRVKAETETGLVVVRDGDLAEFSAMQFPRVSSGRVSFDTSDATAMSAGKEQGRNLRIVGGIETKMGNQGLRLSGKS